MGKPADLGGSVFALTIAHGNLGDFHIQLAGAEEQVKVAERVEIAKELTVRLDLAVIGFKQHLGAA